MLRFKLYCYKISWYEMSIPGQVGGGQIIHNKQNAPPSATGIAKRLQRQFRIHSPEVDPDNI